MINTIKDLSENYFDEILAIRRHLHMYPELSFQEFETSKYIKEISVSYTHLRAHET